MTRIHVLVTALAIGAVMACSTTVERVADSRELQLLGFLQGDSVSRQEVEGRMGRPGSTYENGRIVTYALSKPGDRFEVGGTQAHYTLVIVYRTDGTLERWSLIDTASSR